MSEFGRVTVITKLDQLSYTTDFQERGIEPKTSGTIVRWPDADLEVRHNNTEESILS